jgi:glucan biosynthesis protein C
VTYGAAADWYYMEVGEVSLVASILLVMVSALGIGFSMGLFFLIAGYFTPPAYDRKGAGRFLVDRLKRLGIPWLIFEVVINPLLHYAVDAHDGGNCTGAFYDCQYQGSFWEYMEEYPRNIGSWASSPVWFLEALLIFSFCYAAWRLVAGQVAARRSSDLGRARPVPGNGSIALFALAIGLSSFVVRFWASAGVYFEPFHLELARFPQYIALFVAGVWAYRNGWLAAFSDRQASTWGWLTLACILTLPALAVAAGAIAGSIDEQIFGGVTGYRWPIPCGRGSFACRCLSPCWPGSAAASTTRGGWPGPCPSLPSPFTSSIRPSSCRSRWP